MTEQTCKECIRKFGLDQKILWHCPEGKTPETCGRRFSWANRPIRKKEIVSDPISGCQVTSLVIPSIQDYEVWLEGHGVLVAEAKTAMAEFENPTKIYDSKTLIVSKEAFERLVEAVQNL